MFAAVAMVFVVSEEGLYGVEPLAAPAVLGCNLCYSYVEELYMHHKEVDLIDGTRVPAIRRPMKRDSDAAPLVPCQSYPVVSHRMFPSSPTVHLVIISG